MTPAFRIQIHDQEINTQECGPGPVILEPRFSRPTKKNVVRTQRGCARRSCPRLPEASWLTLSPPSAALHQTLEAKGVLGRLRAQIRSEVFNAMSDEER